MHVSAFVFVIAFAVRVKFVVSPNDVACPVFCVVSCPVYMCGTAAVHAPRGIGGCRRHGYEVWECGWGSGRGFPSVSQCSI